MKYIEVFDSDDRDEFYSVLNFLISKGVSVQTLYEYRFENHTDFLRGAGPAFIRVLNVDVPIAEKWIEQWRSSQVAEVPFPPPYSQNSKLNQDQTEHWRNLLLGKEITAVEYVMPNKSKVDYGNIHFSDAGILLYLNNDQLFAWYFVEGDIDYDLDMENPRPYPNHVKAEIVCERPDFLWGRYEKKMKKDSHWNKLLNSEIVDLKVYTQELLSMNCITDIHFQTKNGAFHLCSGDEPVKGRSEQDFDLQVTDYGVIVLFHDEWIQKRLKF